MLLVFSTHLGWLFMGNAVWPIGTDRDRLASGVNRTMTKRLTQRGVIVFQSASFSDHREHV